LSARFPGINLDSQADLHALPLQSIKVPTLVVSARDDLFNTLPAARYLAGRIPGAKLIVYEEGGHLLVGHEQQVMTEVGKFIAATIANSSS
ncbi:MAG TPA: alpha/beta hydrolase, partial [Rhizomicrobium sp.]|nr:alpha/beta hydrolase [Rhizomicrobium sp.]